MYLTTKQKQSLKYPEIYSITHTFNTPSGLLSGKMIRKLCLREVQVWQSVDCAKVTPFIQSGAFEKYSMILGFIISG